MLVERCGVTSVELEVEVKARGTKVTGIPTYRWALPKDTRPLIDFRADDFEVRIVVTEGSLFMV